MTLQDATTIFATCDLSKDDCGTCCLLGDRLIDLGELGTFHTSPCALLQEAEQAVLGIPLPEEVEIPHAQG